MVLTELSFSQHRVAFLPFSDGKTVVDEDSCTEEPVPPVRKARAPEGGRQTQRISHRPILKEPFLEKRWP